MINSIQQGIAGSLSFHAIVELVGDKLREVLRIDTIGIRWYDHATRTAHFLYEIEHGTRVTMAPVTPSEARWKEVTSDRSVIVRNTAAEVAAAGVAAGTECSLSSRDGEDHRRRSGRRRRRRRELRARVRLRPGRDPVAADDRRRNGRRPRERAAVRRDAAAAEGDRAAQRRAGGHQQRPAGDRRRADIQGIYDAVGDKIREMFHGRDVGIRIVRSRDPHRHASPTLRARPATSSAAASPTRAAASGPHIFRTGETLLDQPRRARRDEALRQLRHARDAGDREVELLVPMVGGDDVSRPDRARDFEREDGFDESDVRLLQTLAASMARGARERAPVRRDAAAAEGDRARRARSVGALGGRPRPVVVARRVGR